MIYLAHMKLSSEELDKLAHLTRLDVPAGEREMLQEQVGAVLEYVASLQKIDVTGVDPTFRGVELGQRLREDAAVASDPETRQALLDAAPERSGDFVKAQAALGHKQG